MFRFETQSFYDFLMMWSGFFFVVVSFAGGGGGGIIENWIVHCSVPFWKITDAHIYCIYLFNRISYGIHREGKEIQKMSDFMKKPAETLD